MYYPAPSSYYPNQSNVAMDNTPSLSLLLDNASLIMSLDDFKQIARIDNDFEDTALSLFAHSAQDIFESHCRVSLMPKKYVQSMRWFDFKRRDITLLRWPVSNIESIVYRDEAGVAHTIDSSNYELVGKETKPSVIRPNVTTGYEWPRTDNLNGSVQITFTAGFETTAEIPAMYKKAVSELTHYYYDFRVPVISGVSVNELPDGILRILNRCRISYINS